MTAYGWVVVGQLTLGLPPAVYFGWTYARSTSHPWSVAAIDAAGWVYGLAAAYMLSLTSLAIDGPPLNPPPVRFAYGVVLWTILTGLLWARAIRWFQIQRTVRMLDRRESRVGDEGEGGSVR
jgi:hypothetical protein